MRRLVALMLRVEVRNSCCRPVVAVSPGELKVRPLLAPMTEPSGHSAQSPAAGHQNSSRWPSATNATTPVPRPHPFQAWQKGMKASYVCAGQNGSVSHYYDI